MCNRCCTGKPFSSVGVPSVPFTWNAVESAAFESGWPTTWTLYPTSSIGTGLTRFWGQTPNPSNFLGNSGLVVEFDQFQLSANPFASEFIEPQPEFGLYGGTITLASGGTLAGQGPNTRSVTLTPGELIDCTQVDCTKFKIIPTDNGNFSLQKDVFVPNLGINPKFYPADQVSFGAGFVKNQPFNMTRVFGGTMWVNQKGPRTWTGSGGSDSSGAPFSLTLVLNESGDEDSGTDVTLSLDIVPNGQGTPFTTWFSGEAYRTYTSETIVTGGPTSFTSTPGSETFSNIPSAGWDTSKAVNLATWTGSIPSDGACWVRLTGDGPDLWLLQVRDH